MPFGPPERSARFPLGPVRVGNPVSSYHGARLVNDVAFLLASNAQTIADCTLDYAYGGGNADVTAFYIRSPGAQALLVGVEFQELDGGSATVTVTNNGSALTWLEANSLDGAHALPTPPGSTHIPQMFHGIADVSGLTVGTLYRLKFAVTTATAATLQRVFVREIPEAQIAPESAPTTEVGANAAWPFYRPGRHDASAGLVAGVANDALGFVRLIDQIEHARTQWKNWRQWCYPEIDASAPQTTSTVMGAFTWPGAVTYTPSWYTRARHLYGTTAGTATSENVQVFARYKCGGTGGTIRVIADGVNNDFAVAAAGAYTTVTLGTMSFKNAAASQRVLVQLNAKVTTAGTLYVPTIAFASLES